MASREAHSFTLNGDLWQVYFVSDNDPILIDRTGLKTVATTDPNTRNVYLSESLTGDFLVRVFIHELGHCALISFNLLSDIHKLFNKRYWIEAEEWICNFIADYGFTIFKVAYSFLGDDIILILPYEIEKLLI